MKKITIADWVQAIHCFGCNSYIEYNQIETSRAHPRHYEKELWHKVMAENERVMTNQQTPERILVKRDLYDKLCDDSKWLLISLCSGSVDIKIKSRGVRTYLIKNGWSRKRIRVVFTELKQFMSDITEG